MSDSFVPWKRPKLIQRLSARTAFNEAKSGIDSYFQFDYMGRSEFEWGALPAALRAMREAKGSDIWTPWQISIVAAAGKSGATMFDVPQSCWYVGPDSQRGAAQELFADELLPLDERRHRLLEASYIHDTYFPDADRNGLHKTDGWWAIDSTFVLFRRKDHAKTWLTAI